MSLEQLELLAWKGNNNVDSKAAQGAGHVDQVRRHGRDGLRGEGVHGQHVGSGEPGVVREGRLGSRPALDQQEPGPVSVSPQAREVPSLPIPVETSSREGGEGREAQGEVLAKPNTEEAAQEEGERDNVYTLGGLRPGSRYVVMPGANQLWWKPCLKREEGGAREHCWFIAPTSYPSLFCPSCHGVTSVHN